MCLSSPKSTVKSCGRFRGRLELVTGEREPECEQGKKEYLERGQPVVWRLILKDEAGGKQVVGFVACESRFVELEEETEIFDRVLRAMVESVSYRRLVLGSAVESRRFLELFSWDE